MRGVKTDTFNFNFGSDSQIKWFCRVGSAVAATECTEFVERQIFDEKFIRN
jgi:hypothetical protein